MHLRSDSEILAKGTHGRIGAEEWQGAREVCV